MFCFIIGIIVAIILIVHILIDSFYEWYEKILCPILIIPLMFILSGILTLTVSAFVSSCAEIDYNMVSDTKIIALKDNENINGSFYIMGGYVNEELYYYYATETEFGYKTEKVKADNAYIKYTNEESHIEKYQGKFVNDRVNFWAVPICPDRYTIYCPEGTITNEFNVDLE